MATSDADDEFDDAIRRFRHERREFEEEVEAGVEQLERSRRTLDEVVLEFMHRGDTLRVSVGAHSWSGQVVHVAPELLTLRTPAESEIDVALDAITSIRVVARSPSGDGNPPTSHPGSLLARLRELTVNDDEEVEIAGALLDTPITGCVVGVAPSHVEVRARDGGEWVLPLAEVGFVIRQPRRR